MREVLTIDSHKGPYVVHFVEDILSTSKTLLEGDPHVIIDANVARVYKSELLVQHKIRRSNHLRENYLPFTDVDIPDETFGKQLVTAVSSLA